MNTSKIWQTLKVQTRYLFLTLLGPPFDGSTIPYSTLLSFCSSPGAKAARPLSGYPGLFYLDERHCDLTRNYVVKNDAILYRQKQYKILAPKTTESFGAKNYTNGFRCCDWTKTFGAKTTENCGAKNYTICFRCCDLTEKIWCLTNSQFFVHIHPVFPLNHLVLKPCFSYLQGQRLRGLYPDIPAFYLTERPSQRARGHGRSWADLFTSHAQNLRWTRKVISNEYIDILFSDKANTYSLYFGQERKLMRFPYLSYPPGFA